MSAVRCQMSDVCLICNVRCLVSDATCPISDLRCLMSDVQRLLPDVRCVQSAFWCQISDVCNLMSDVRFLMSDVWWLMTYVRCLLSDVFGQMMPDVRCLMPEVRSVWSLMSDVSTCRFYFCYFTYEKKVIDLAIQAFMTSINFFRVKISMLTGTSKMIQINMIGSSSAAYVKSLKINIILNGKYKMEIISKTSS